MHSNAVTVVIRSVGERTEKLCRELILAQGVPEDAVFVVHEVPFSESMRAAFKIGIDQNRPWTFCVDADTLLRPGSIAYMLKVAERQRSNVCEVQGLVLDKFFGGFRPAGNHWYRTAFLDRVISYIPEEGDAVRPETHALNQMQAAGYPWRKVPYVVGLHDFEQHYADIFRKCVVQAHKHKEFCPFFISFWHSRALADTDYRVALGGLARGIAYTGTVAIDVRKDEYRLDLDQYGLEKKSDIPLDEWSPDSIETMVRGWQMPLDVGEFRGNPYDLDGKNLFFVYLTYVKLLANKRIQEFGWLRVLPYALGLFFFRLGRWLQKTASSNRERL